MPRGPRRPAESGIHHVMNRGVDHQAVFFDDVDRCEFGRLLAAIHADDGVTTLAYCLMDNHFHLLLRAPPDTLSAAMQHLLGVYTRHTNDRVGRDGPLFRGRFHSIPVETDAYLLQAGRYIHRNPLDLPGVRSPRGHRWSSYRAYLGLRPVAEFLDIGPISDLLGGPDRVAEFTEADQTAGVEHRGPVTAADLRQLIGRAIAIDDMTHPDDDGAHQWLDRTILVLLADRSPDPVVRRLAEQELGDRSRKAETSSLRRALARHDSEPAVRRILASVEGSLGAEWGLTPLLDTEWV